MQNLILQKAKNAFCKMQTEQKQPHGPPTGPGNVPCRPLCYQTVSRSYRGANLQANRLTHVNNQWAKTLLAKLTQTRYKIYGMPAPKRARPKGRSICTATYDREKIKRQILLSIFLSAITAYPRLGCAVMADKKVDNFLHDFLNCDQRVHLTSTNCCKMVCKGGAGFICADNGAGIL